LVQSELGEEEKMLVFYMEQLCNANFKDDKMHLGMLELKNMGYLNFALNRNLMTKHHCNLPEVMEHMLDGNIGDSAFN